LGKELQNPHVIQRQGSQEAAYASLSLLRVSCRKKSGDSWSRTEETSDSRTGQGHLAANKGAIHMSCLSVVDCDKYLPDIQHPGPEPGPEAADAIAGQRYPAYFQGCG
jgi:hypothetical protein